jgi:hypothetical protein
MYKVLIATSNSQIPEHLNVINKESGKIVSVTTDKYAMYLIYEISEHRSEIWFIYQEMTGIV